MTAVPPETTNAPVGGIMHGIAAVFRHELRLLFYHPLSYLFQIAFVTALAACVFLIADFYATDEATIRPMLTFLPWVALILVPALAMRAWVDDQGDRALELTMTLPVGTGAVVVGKFLAGYVVLLATLALTLPFAATVYYLGEPDPGVIVAGYVAAALLLGTYYAVALFAAALAREQVGAFVIGITVLFVLLLLGWDVFGRVLRDVAPAAVIEMLTLYSPNTWLVRVGRGVVDFASLFYFVAVSAIALAGAAMAIEARRKAHSAAVGSRRSGAAKLAGLLLPAALIPAATHVPGAIDLTAEREFSLHPGTLQVLRRVPAGTELTLYWSAGESSVPAAIKTHARRTVDLLKLLTGRAGGRLALRVVDPQPDTDEELQAQADGVRRVPMSSGDNFFLGLTFKHGARTGSIPYLDIRRDRFLEYDIAVGLNNLTRTRTPRIGILSPLIPSAAAIGHREGMSFLSELKNAYDIAVIPHFKTALPDGLDVLMLIDATILRREMLYAIDQFVVRGGGLIVMIDPYMRFNRASNMINPSPSEEINDISDLLLKYGIRYHGESVVGDRSLASVVSDGSQAKMSFPFWMRIGRDQLSPSHPVSANLNEVFMVEPGAFEIVEPDRARPIVTTTENSGALLRGEFNDKVPQELALAFKPDGRRRVIAAALRGPFSSAFSRPPEGTQAAAHVSQATRTGAVFAVADVDWLFDPFSLQQTTVGGRALVRPLNDNLSLLLNMVEYASGDQALIAIRSRGNLQRPFTRVAALFQATEKRYKEEESRLVDRIAEIENRLAAFLQAAGVTNIDELPPGIAADIKKFRMELLPARRKLRQVRHEIRAEIDALGRRLTVINLVAPPLGVLLFAGWVFALRRRRS